jgi:hypothetical protein
MSMPGNIYNICDQDGPDRDLSAASGRGSHGRAEKKAHVLGRKDLSSKGLGSCPELRPNSPSEIFLRQSHAYAHGQCHWFREITVRHGRCITGAVDAESLVPSAIAVST